MLHDGDNNNLQRDWNQMPEGKWDLRTFTTIQAPNENDTLWSQLSKYKTFTQDMEKLVVPTSVLLTHL